MSVRKKYNLERLTFVLVFAVLLGQGRSQDVGSFLAGLLGATDVIKNETIEDPNQVPCPGECVHALTSILCSKVIEQFNCGAGYLRCCVSSDFTFGTVVETSAPLPEESSTEAGEYDVYVLTTVPNAASTTKLQPQISTAIHTPSQPKPTPQTLDSQSASSSAPSKKLVPCPGICVENIFVRYCSGTYPDGLCETGSTCCVSNHDDAEEPPRAPPLPTNTIATTTTTPATVVTTEKIANFNPQYNQFSDESNLATTLPGPPCPGSCVAPLFSLLCDAVDDNYYCVNDGRCCVNNDEPPAEPTTTTSLPIIPCPGTCIPTFLSGMCNRPSEIILITECDTDFVCCYQPEIKDHLHIQNPQIPLVRPVAPQPGYPSIPLHQNIPPLHQPQNTHTYPQRPQVPVIPNPIILSHSPNPGNANQVYPGNVNQMYPGNVNQMYPGNGNQVPPNPGNANQVYPGNVNQMYSGNVNQMYPENGNQVPQISASAQPKPPPPPHDGPSIIKVPYHPNNNYGGNPYQTQNFIPVIQKPNSSHEHPPVRQSVLAPSNQPESPAVDESFFNRRPNVSHPIPHHSQHIPQALHPSKDNENEAVRLILPAGSVDEILSNPPDDAKKQQNVHNRFVETAIGFAPDSLRPITINIPKKPPSLEKFQPPPPRPSFKPPIKNTSTILVIHVKEPEDNIEVIQDLDFKPESSRPTFIPVHDSFKPVLTHMPLKPTTNPTTTRMKPLTSVSNLKPTTPTEKPKPSQSIDETIAKPSNTNFYTVSAEQAKKMRPACPGSCIGSFLRFTCFGNNAIYDGFACEGSGIMCCTSVDYIEKYEEHLKSGTPLTFVKHETDSTDIQTTIDTTRRPGLYVCGIKGNQRRKTGRVMGGKTSSPGEWCWQVALINAKNQYLCGGALIGSRWVLTAAHCITALVRNGDAIYVRVGDFDLASQTGSPGAQTQKVSTSYIHHNHNGQTLDNDIALLRLENPVQLQESVCLVCLPARGAESEPGKRCTVTGYGYVSETGPIALKIREAELPIVEENLCTEQINKVTEKRFILPAGSFCAGGEPENDACQGDGGGPLTCLNEGYYELTGLVSWGFGCGKEDVPGVYVKVSSYIGWINQIISVNN